ncbi:hypothetical protein [Listeria booriae]|uniref:hypothetical protein n=1 Tax=Listeria booriae TaxID=1552123 RepID=UPI00162803AC|nr:hypothetical protein [Listeria booriae]MBC2306547.1 hypothetical protein [Listeria booriae]
MGGFRDIFEWFIECFKALPESIVTGIYGSLLIFILKGALNKLSKYRSKISGLADKIPSFLSEKPEIGTGYRVIASPEYNFSRRKNRRNALFNGEVWPVIILLLVAAIGGVLLLQQYYVEVQGFFYLTSVIFIFLSLFCLLISVFTNRIQSSTLKFSIFSLIISVYIYYTGVILPKLIAKMPTDISIIKLFEAPRDYWPSIYAFLGIFIAVLEIGIILILLVRLIAIKLDSKKRFQANQRLISATNAFEGAFGLVATFTILTIFSYLLTSGNIVEFVFRNVS